MLTQVSEIAFTATSTPLEAALLESETIKRVSPPYNVQLLQGDRGVWFARADFRAAEPEPDAAHRLGPLTSRHSLRSLGAFVQLFEGAPHGLSLAAAVVGAPARFGPDETSFASGWLLFSERHLAEPSGLSPGRRALDVARRLLELTPEESETTDDAPKLWDGPRVCRHVERAVSQAFRLLRRASWLCLLASSCVAYREPNSATIRCLRIAFAEIAEVSELESWSSLPAPERASRQELQQSFDAARYDSLRILTTELKRILKSGGDVEVRLSRSRRLAGERLSAILRLV
jgi:hypothetical protein